MCLEILAGREHPGRCRHLALAPWTPELARPAPGEQRLLWSSGSGSWVVGFLLPPPPRSA